LVDELAQARRRLAELEASEEQCEKIMQLQKVYAETVAHNLRNLLTVINGRAQIIQRYPDRIELVRASAETLVENARHLNAMIDDLVNSARAVSDVQFEKQPLHLASFVHDLLKRPATRLDIHRVEVQVPAELPAIIANAHCLERVLMNLLTYLLSFSPIDAKVLLQAREANGEVVTSLTAPRPQTTSAEPWRTVGHVYPTCGGRGEWTSPELFFAKLLIEAHDGRIWVESEPGKRDTLHFSLPTA